MFLPPESGLARACWPGTLTLDGHKQGRQGASETPGSSNGCAPGPGPPRIQDSVARAPAGLRGYLRLALIHVFIGRPGALFN